MLTAETLPWIKIADIIEAMIPTRSDNKEHKGSGTPVLTRNEKIALVFFFILALGYASWQYFSRPSRQLDLGQDIPSGIVVQVEGAVEKPGLVYLPGGARVSDAVEAAGGFNSSADREAVNMAGLLTDGQKITIPYADSDIAPEEEADSLNKGTRFTIIDRPVTSNRAGDDTNNENNSVQELVNINTASSTELEELPGIGEQLAGRIVAYREEHGRFETKEDLKQVEGIGDVRFDEIKDLITVGD